MIQYSTGDKMCRIANYAYMQTCKYLRRLRLSNEDGSVVVGRNLLQARWYVGMCFPGRSCRIPRKLDSCLALPLFCISKASSLICLDRTRQASCDDDGHSPRAGRQVRQRGPIDTFHASTAESKGLWVDFYRTRIYQTVSSKRALSDLKVVCSQLMLGSCS